ncbi:hypothetical protein Clacol_004383 [Clathrus columnatus]|uniref:Uncharacterized protein n=1 Tax=Clathrus columnatus TaxID=1419009 RepID=A0AAV5A6C5_9AGAM|nr:hypothetical protein Clacol_004383 [Clathrus columnatus]
MKNLSHYPLNTAPNNCPVQHIIESSAGGAGYTTYNTEADSALLDTCISPLTQSSGVLDTDRQESTYKLRKVEMVKNILKKTPFVKFPAQNCEPLKTSYNPDVYAMLWPTLFPYGVGLFEDEICSRKSAGMRPLDLKWHVNHVLNLADTWFQRHIMFSFVMMNIIQ